MHSTPVRVFCLILLLLACGAPSAQNHKNQPLKNSRSAEYSRQAARLAASMDIKTLCAQVLITAVDGQEAVSGRTRSLLKEVPAGGILLFTYNVSPDSEKTRAFIEELYQCIEDISLPPFIASDQEGGSVQRIRGKAALPAPLSYWERFSALTEMAERSIFIAAEQDAVRAGKELRRLGVTMNLAPVAEVLTTENQSLLKTRSYGPDAAFTVSAASAFMRGMESAGVASTLKHYPGNSSADPHRSRAVLDLSGTELENLTAPFEKLIREETPAVVMVSHVIIPAWDSKPCSLSTASVRRLRAIGFTGIVMADDFSMTAAGSPIEVCTVEALAAGVDMIMTWSGNLKKAHQAILSAVETGKLSEERVREAAQRIICQKIRYGIIR